jgi:hypothetical protein
MTAYTKENVHLPVVCIDYLSLENSRKRMPHYRFLKAELYSSFYCYLLYNLQFAAVQVCCCTGVTESLDLHW